MHAPLASPPVELLAAVLGVVGSLIDAAARLRKRRAIVRTRPFPH